jgi:hypothetical protein
MYKSTTSEDIKKQLEYKNIFTSSFPNWRSLEGTFHTIIIIIIIIQVKQPLFTAQPSLQDSARLHSVSLLRISQ